MCGRTAQTEEAVEAAARSLHVQVNLRGDGSSTSGKEAAASSQQASADTSSNDKTSSATVDATLDNYNLSPGMEAFVFWNDAESHQVRCEPKVWGLVTKHGTANAPLPKGMSAHFSNLMFNARSDTLYTKPTFGRLANTPGRTCLIAVDGFFEWKAAAANKASQKQPYFVYRKKTDETAERPYLLFQGLWTRVQTGREPDDATLDTFTICTTDACPSLQWLHSRMPVTVWDEALALAWLQRPSQAIHEQLEQAAMHTAEGMLDWHKVTREISNLKYRSKNALKALPPEPSITSFFAPVDKNQTKKSGTKSKITSSQKKKDAPKRTAPSSSSLSSHSSSAKKPKKGQITSFFSPK